VSRPALRSVLDSVPAVEPVNRTYAPLQAFVEELFRCGVSHAVTSPGSRNAPLVLTLAAQSGIEAVSIIDERSAGFAALGMAKESGRPVAVACTSGTASANLLPAVVEAHEARVPLIVLTADRPPELRDTGAGQAIDQIKLYGGFVKWFVEVGNHEPGRGSAVHHRALACRAFWTAAGGRPGPVHLNFPLREPLAPVREALDPDPWQGRTDGRPWVEVAEPPRVTSAEQVHELAARLAGRRGAIVCGATAEDVAVPAARLAQATGWPLLAEPTSGVRCGSHDRSHVIAHYDVLLRNERFAADHAAEVVVRIGDTPTSKPLRTWLQGASQIVVDPHAVWHEPTRTAETMVVAEAASTCAALTAALEAGERRRAEGWIDSWRAADALVPPALAAAPANFEPRFGAALARALPAGATLWVSSSMPIRDVEAFFPQRPEALRILANRGANGIDGVVSSALGASITAGGPCVLLIGEVALVHDAGGLLAAGRRAAALTIVCLNNGGGGIFDLLPLAQEADAGPYAEHILTPTGVQLSALAAATGLPYTLAADTDELAQAVRRPGLIEVQTDRQLNAAARRDLHEAVGAALEPVPGATPDH
jgi:2-succinyl-5-enolpyruvyl-6-hydroxy-3-cyclohexene-1-carboxylate synthase